MSSEERKKILKMVEEGKVTAEEAAQLLKALEETAEVEGNALEAGAGTGSERSGAEFEQVRVRARRLASIPLWIGVFLTLLSAYWLFTLVQRSNYGVWFACAWLPLVAGVLLLALSASGPHTRWLYVNVEQQPGEWPQHITLGLPLPLGLATWAWRNFGHLLRGAERARAEEILSLLASTNAHQPLIVNVDEGESGERVQVYIG
ncbi:MAG: hypothetical protein Fur0043_02040 [Anaerolineales bacterium]